MSSNKVSDKEQRPKRVRQVLHKGFEAATNEISNILKSDSSSGEPVVGHIAKRQPTGATTVHINAGLLNLKYRILLKQQF